MRQAFWVFAFGVLLAATSNASVTYSTTGTFNCLNAMFDGAGDSLSGCGTSAVTVLGGGTDNEAITFNFAGETNNTVNPTTVAGYGVINLSCTGTGCGSPATPIFLPSGILSLLVSVSESGPDVVGSTPIPGSGTLSGNVSGSSSNVGVAWGTNVTLTGGTASINYTPFSLQFLNAPTSSGGNTSVSMIVSDVTPTGSNTPEPASLGLIGGGLVGLGLISRRKRANRTA